MTISRRQIALLKVAAKQVELSAAEYRHMLVLAGGVTSATELDRDGFEAALAILEHLGFRPLGSGGPFYGERPGFASPAEVEYIRGLWRRWSGKGDWAALDAWLARSFGCASLRFASAEVADRAINGLRAMTRRGRSGTRDATAA